MGKRIGFILAATGGAAVLAFGGCAGLEGHASIGNSTTTVNNFGGEARSREAVPPPRLNGAVNPGASGAANPGASGAAATAPGAAAPVFAPGAVPAVDGSRSRVVVLGDRRDLLRVRLCPEGDDAAAGKLGASIGGALAGALGENSARIVTGDGADLRIVIRPRLDEIDRAGEYYRINTTVNLEIKDVDARRVYGVREVKVVGKRTLGEARAIAELAAPATRESVAWIQQTLKNLAENGLDVAILKIRLPGAVRDVQRDNAAIHAVARNLGRLGGVVSYGFVGYDGAEGVVEYRMVYFKESYPGGIANAVGALLGGATELK